MNWKPIGDQVLLKQLEKQDKTQSGIIIMNSLDDYIFKSFILRQNNKQESSKLILTEGLKMYPEKDTLVKLYELFSFISKNKEKRSSILTDEKGIVGSESYFFS